MIDGVDISSHQASAPVWSDLLGQGFCFEAPDRLPAGSPVGFERDGEIHLVFRSVENHLREAVRSAAGQWRLADLGNESCVADPSLYHLDGAAHVVFRAADGNVHEFVFDGAWRHELTS